MTEKHDNAEGGERAEKQATESFMAFVTGQVDQKRGVQVPGVERAELASAQPVMAGFTLVDKVIFREVVLNSLVPGAGKSYHMEVQYNHETVASCVVNEGEPDKVHYFNMASTLPMQTFGGEQAQALAASFVAHGEFMLERGSFEPVVDAA